MTSPLSSAKHPAKPRFAEIDIFSDLRDEQLAMVCLQREGNEALSRGRCSFMKAIPRMRCSFCSKEKSADAGKTEARTGPAFWRAAAR